MFTSTPCPSCSASQVLMRWWHLVDIPSNNLLPALSPGTEQSHFSLHKHSCSAYSPLQEGSSSCYWWHLTTKKANIWSEHIGQKHQVNVSHWLDRTKAITSLHLSDEQQHKKKEQGACISHTVWSLFLWASTVSGCQGRHDGGGVIVIPIWPHNEFRARHGGY